MPTTINIHREQNLVSFVINSGTERGAKKSLTLVTEDSKSGQIEFEEDLRKMSPEEVFAYLHQVVDELKVSHLGFPKAT